MVVAFASEVDRWNYQHRPESGASSFGKHGMGDSRSEVDIRAMTLARLAADVIDYARSFSQRIAAKSNDEELREWISIARSRELSVSVGYAYPYVKPHLASMRDRGFSVAFIEVFRRRIGEIWKQERAHVRFFVDEPVLSWSQIHSPSRCERRKQWLRGWLAPKLLKGIADSSASKPLAWFSRALRYLVSASRRLPWPLRDLLADLIRDFPEFLQAFEAAVPFGMEGFCRINAALERTAVEGYERIGILIRSLRLQGRELSLTAESDIAVTIHHEAWHEAVFEALADSCRDIPPAAEMGSALATLASRLERLTQTYLAVRAGIDMTADAAVALLNQKWALILKGLHFVELGAHPEQPHFVVFIDPADISRLRPPGHRARKIKFEEDTYPALAAVCRALGRKSVTVDVIWDGTYSTPTGAEGNWRLGLRAAKETIGRVLAPQRDPIAGLGRRGGS
jgi:hypothetical protein